MSDLDDLRGEIEITATRRAALAISANVAAILRVFIISPLLVPYDMQVLQYHRYCNTSGS